MHNVAVSVFPGNPASHRTECSVPDEGNRDQLSDLCVDRSLVFVLPDGDTNRESDQGRGIPVPHVAGVAVSDGPQGCVELVQPPCILRLHVVGRADDPVDTAIPGVKARFCAS